MGLTDRHVEAVRKGARVSRGLSTRNQHPLVPLSFRCPASLTLGLSSPPFLPAYFNPRSSSLSPTPISLPSFRFIYARLALTRVLSLCHSPPSNLPTLNARLPLVFPHLIFHFRLFFPWMLLRGYFWYWILSLLFA